MTGSPHSETPPVPPVGVTGPPHQRLSFDTIEVSSIGLLSQVLKPHVLWLTRIPHGDRDGSGDRAYAAVPKSHIRASGGKALLVPLRRSGVTRRVELSTARVVDMRTRATTK